MRRFVVRALVALLILISALGAILIGTLAYGHVSGEEFAPDTFERRLYSYFELPVVRLQVTPVRRMVSTSRLASRLAESKYLPTSNPPRRWDFVRSMRLGQPWREGDALILTQYLDTWSGGGDLHWLDWTYDHPELAKILWPAVAKLAQQELYLFTPDLFALAAEQTEAQAFEGALKRLLGRKYEELAQLEYALGNYAAAVRFFDESLGYEPNGEVSLRGRAEARAALTRSQVEQP